jgi:hypothetical protein
VRAGELQHRDHLLRAGRGVQGGDADVVVDLAPAGQVSAELLELRADPDPVAFQQLDPTGPISVCADPVDERADVDRHPVRRSRTTTSSSPRDSSSKTRLPSAGPRQLAEQPAAVVAGASTTTAVAACSLPGDAAHPKRVELCRSTHEDRIHPTTPGRPGRSLVRGAAASTARSRRWTGCGSSYEFPGRSWVA